MSESAASAGSEDSRRSSTDVAQSSQSIECVSRVMGSGRRLTRGEATGQTVYQLKHGLLSNYLIEQLKHPGLTMTLP